MIAYKRPSTIGQTLTNYKHLALNKRESMSRMCRFLAATVLFVVTTGNTTNQWCHVFHK